MVYYHPDGQGIVDIHEECINRIVTLGLNRSSVDSGNGIQESRVVGILAAVRKIMHAQCVSVCVT